MARGAIAVPHLLPYSCAKFAMRGFSEGLGAELAKDRIRVTTVLPWLMRTGSFLNALFKGKREEELAWFALGSTMPVVSMQAERAARRIVDACERGEAFVTLGMQAKVLRIAHSLAPGLATRVLGMVNSLLPGPGGAGPMDPAEPGYQHRSPVKDRMPRLPMSASASPIAAQPQRMMQRGSPIARSNKNPSRLP